MRFHFPNGEHDDYPFVEGRLLIGSGEGANLRIGQASVAAEHVDISVGRVRGIEIDVRPGAELYVNGRLIKERGLARLGDVLMLGSVQILLRGDSDRREQPPEPTEDLYRKLPPRASLRAVSGQHFGKMIALKPRNIIGRGPECDVVLNDPSMSRQHALIENTSSGLFLRDLESANGTYLNGVPVRDAVLKSGDQIAFDTHRFVIEVVGYSPLDGPAPSRPTPTQVLRAATQPGSGPVTPLNPTANDMPPPIPLAPESESRATQWANLLLIVAALSALAILVYVFGYQGRR
jgi:pSer/pThr/pTyr-binding forkhead associated (FHA) protein